MSGCKPTLAKVIVLCPVFSDHKASEHGCPGVFFSFHFAWISTQCMITILTLGICISFLIADKQFRGDKEFDLAHGLRRYSLMLGKAMVAVHAPHCPSPGFIQCGTTVSEMIATCGFCFLSYTNLKTQTLGGMFPRGFQIWSG